MSSQECKAELVKVDKFLTEEQTRRHIYIRCDTGSSIVFRPRCGQNGNIKKEGDLVEMEPKMQNGICIKCLRMWD